jgi:pyrophosphatase PpaX
MVFNTLGVDAVIFDIGNTLVPTTDFVYKAIVEAFTSNGLTAPQFKEMFNVSGRSKKNVFPPHVYADYEKVMNDHVYLLKPFEGSDRTIQTLKKLGYKICSFTAFPKSVVDVMFKTFGWDMPFLSSDDVEEARPSPMGILKSADMLGSKPSECVAVGDTIGDILSAKAAGTHVIAVATGLFSYDALQKESPDVVINTIEEVLQILK